MNLTHELTRISHTIDRADVPPQAKARARRELDNLLTAGLTPQGLQGAVRRWTTCVASWPTQPARVVSMTAWGNR